jgi:hypothetical protein
LAFHPYAQVIPQVFNPGGFGPPRGLTRASTCPCVDHPASGPRHATENALFRLAFATATRHRLTSPRTVTRRLILQKARGHITPPRKEVTLPRLAGTRFQVLFHDPSPGCFSPFPHGTSSLSVTREYSGLGGGPPRFTRDFTGPVLLGNTPGETAQCHLRDYHPLWPDFPDCSATTRFCNSPPARQHWQDASRYPPYATPAGYHTHEV